MRTALAAARRAVQPRRGLRDAAVNGVGAQQLGMASASRSRVEGGVGGSKCRAAAAPLSQIGYLLAGLLARSRADFYCTATSPVLVHHSWLTSFFCARGETRLVRSPPLQTCCARPSPSRPTGARPQPQRTKTILLNTWDVGRTRCTPYSLQACRPPPLAEPREEPLDFARKWRCALARTHARTHATRQRSHPGPNTYLCARL
jgi:hypothetical protein